VETDCLGHYYPIQCDRANLDLMRAHTLFKDRNLLRKRVADFLRGRRQYLEAFEAQYGGIPEPIRESLPYREAGNALIERLNGQ
jgi:phosphoenolpyruvate carboxykinase (ATP)